MNLFMIFFLTVIWLFIYRTQAQTTVQTFSEASSKDESLDIQSTIETSTTSPKKPVSGITVDSDLPLPSGLSKSGATETTLSLRYRPPPRYLSDGRFTHFRIEYKRLDAVQWKIFDLPKISDANNVILRDLSEGVLYVIRIRSLRRTDFDEARISNASDSILARTKPLPVTQLSVVRSPGNWSDVVVSWVKPPFEPFKDKYDVTVLNYYIKNLKEDQKREFPSKNITFKATPLFGNRNVNPKVTLALVPGATYRFEVYTKSLGVDETKSNVMFVDETFEIPGPINLIKKLANQTSLHITWEPRPWVTNITEYQVTWLRDGSEERFELTTNRTEVELFRLDSGARYVIRVKSVQNHRFFGKLSEESLLNTRTDPPPIRNAEITQRFSTILRFQFTIPLTNFDKILVNYRTADGSTAWKKASETTVNKTTRVGEAALSLLQPGALYEINISVLSEPNPQTVSNFTLFARTNPTPPTNARATAERGTIYVTWRAPDMYSQARWRYRVEYHLLDMKNETKTLCQAKGQPLQKISLPDLKPGHGYSISITTVAGEDCSQSASALYPTWSTSPQKLVAYTQPEYPTILYWKQATVNAVRIVWSMKRRLQDSKFDSYLVGVRRLRDSRSFVAFEAEEFVERVSKDRQNLVLRLSQGAYYRINVTAAVGPDGLEQKSLVIPETNSIRINTWYRYYDQFPFPRLEWNFSTCGRSGRIGPSQLLCDSSYSKSNLHQLVSVHQGIQHWIAPVDGLYQIVAAGAGYEGPGGSGAVVSGQFHLKEGTVLKIAVGQRGKRLGPGMVVGGGGGSFVVLETKETHGVIESDEAELLIVAGGAGSAPLGSPPADGMNGQLSYIAGNASEVGNQYGRGGIAESKMTSSGMRGVSGTGGGAGYYGIADSPVELTSADKSYPAIGFEPFVEKHQFLNESEKVEYAPLTGGRYEIGPNRFSEGGFGGGGSGYLSAFGGGGGYSGGGGGPTGGYSGGGGSFVKITGGKEQAEVTNTMPGFVRISVIGLPLISPVPVTLYLVISFLCGIAVTFLCGAGLYGVNRPFSYVSDRNVIIERNLSLRPVSEREVFKRSGSLSSSHGPDIVNDEYRTEEFSPEPDANPWKAVLKRYKEMYDESSSDTLSTISSVSSMTTSLNKNKLDADAEIGKISYRGKRFSKSTSSDIDYDSSLESSIVYPSSVGGRRLFFSPSHYPPELGNQRQKQEFQENLKRFQKISEKNRTKEGERLDKQSVIFSNIEI